jgi:hypothetical protein
MDYSYRLHECAYTHRCRDRWTDESGMKRGAKIEDRAGAEGNPVTSERGLCRKCFGMVRGALRSIEADYHKLCAAVGDHGASGEVHVSGTREPPMPLNGAVLALRSTLSEWSEAALWMVAEPLGIDVRERHKAKGWPVKDGPVIVQAARILPENMKLLLEADKQPVAVWSASGSNWRTQDLDGVDVAMKLADIHHEVNQVLGLDKLRQRSAMPCPNFECAQRGTLGIDNGTDVVNCTACGRQWSRSEYDWLLSLLVTEEQEKEATMLKFLLAEAQWWCDILAWCIAERDHKLWQIGRLSRMTPADLEGIDGYAVVELVREML